MRRTSARNAPASGSSSATQPISECSISSRAPAEANRLLRRRCKVYGASVLNLLRAAGAAMRTTLQTRFLRRLHSHVPQLVQMAVPSVQSGPSQKLQLCSLGTAC